MMLKDIIHFLYCKFCDILVKIVDKNGQSTNDHLRFFHDSGIFLTFAPEKEGVPPFFFTPGSGGVHVAHGTHRENCWLTVMNELLSLGNVETKTIVITDASVLHEAFLRWQKEEVEKRELERENTRISAKEAAQRLGVTLSTLWRWEKEKYLVPIKVGKRNTYRLRDVLSIMEGGGYGATSI